jgi:hypothetical protein
MNKYVSFINNRNDLIPLLRKYLGLVLYVAICFEMFFYPSLENLVGCIMELVVWFVFRFFLRRKVIVEHPFAFLVFLTSFLARYIPLIATLLEGKPITYGFENSFSTFFWETVLFIVISSAFYTSVKYKSRSWNFLQKTLYKHNFFKSDTRSLWLLGLIGTGVRFQQLYVSGNVESFIVSKTY